MDSSKIKALFIAALGVFFAIYLGITAATAQFEAIAWVAGIGMVVFLLALGKNVWVLIPICLGLAGNINLLPGSPAPWWAATFAVAVIFALRFLLRTRELTLRFTWLEFAILLQIVVVAQAFLRNPAGLSLLGGDVVGGKPYIAFSMAFLAYFLLSMIRTDLRTIKWIVILTVIMSLVDGGLMLASVLFPALAAAVLPLYSGVAFTSAISGAEAADTADTRLVGAKDAGEALGKATFTIFRPLSTLNPVKILPFLMMITSVGLILLSGFRSVLGLIVIYAVVSSLVRRKAIDVVVCGLAAALLLMGLIMTDTVRSLPFGAQRILSVLPVDVRPDARDDADKSSEWRFEMWELALFTDRYIHNKLLGDGFNYRRDEMEAMQDAAFGAARGAMYEGQDQMLAKGSYHGFHVEAIRMTGILGLLAALIGMGIFFRYAWIQIQYFRGRPEWGYILYICIPVLVNPFYFMLVFGGYRSGFPLVLVSAALLKILDNIRVAELAHFKLTEAKDELSRLQSVSDQR